MTNTKITDPEELEFRYPVRLLQFAIRSNSGGMGKWKGGDGIIRIIEFLEVVDMTLISQHRAQAPYGLEGGVSGAIGEQYIIDKNGEQEQIKGIVSRKMLPGERLIIKTPGGGGYGENEN